MKHFRIFLVVLIGISVPSCARVTDADIANANYGRRPTNVEQSIRNWAELQLIDPASLRISNVSRVRKGYFSNVRGVVYGYICTAYINSKNRFGGYVGAKPYYFVFHNDEVRIANEDSSGVGKMLYKFVD